MRNAGAYVFILGLPVDLLVGYKGKTVLVEVKDGPRKRLTSLQRVFFENWTGDTISRIDSVEAALRLLKVIDES